MSDPVLEQIQAIIQRDVNNRGLASVPGENLITACQDDFIRACENLANSKPAWVAIVTGFYIPTAGTAETDGPMGTFFLSRVLSKLGWTPVCFIEPDYCDCLHAASRISNYHGPIFVESDYFPRLKTLDPADRMLAGNDWDFSQSDGPPYMEFTHFIAIERAGPSHVRAEIPVEHRDQYHTMRGTIITDEMYPAHRWFENSQGQVTTIGIGDGGNEIGMGKIPWEVIARNVPNGGLVACRVPTDYNIVCGVSNWGAYGLAAGVWRLNGRPFDPELFNADAERELWQKVLTEAVLVDGVTGRRELTVDGLSWEDYIRPLQQIADLLKSKT